MALLVGAGAVYDQASHAAAGAQGFEPPFDNAGLAGAAGFDPPVNRNQGRTKLAVN